MSAKILLIDDDDNLRDTWRDVLEMEDYEIVEAADADQAMRAVVGGTFDLILTDYNLPDKNGIDLIKDIRKINTESEILMMTAHGSLDTAVKAIQESVFDFLVKPVDINYLKRALEKALEQMRLRRENERLMEQLRRSNEQLLNLNNMKSKFLSMASHDLSNSLMTLQVSFEMMVQNMAPSEDQKKKIEYISSGISQISRLIGDLVDWASIESGKFRLEKTSFPIAQMIDELIPGVRSRAAHKQIEIDSRIGPNLPPLNADKRRLGQVVLNLTENAIRHTPRGGRITVSVEMKGPEFHVSVKDTGDGIEPAELDKLFRSFYQPQGAAPSQKGRLGLGLSIAKEIVQSHQGRIWVESDGKGHGSTFHFTLPAVKAPQGGAVDKA